MCFCSINQSATLKSEFYLPNGIFTRIMVLLPLKWGLRVPQTKLKEGILDIGIKK
jgi:hypothetical protein